MDPVAIRRVLWREPLRRYLVTRERRWPAGEDKLCLGSRVQHQWDRVEQLSDTFALNKTATIEHERRPRWAAAERCTTGRVVIFDAVTDRSEERRVGKEGRSPWSP